MNDLPRPMPRAHNSGTVCALCGEPFTNAPASLNGVAVCKRCRNAFVGRRQSAFIIDLVLFALAGNLVEWCAPRLQISGGWLDRLTIFALLAFMLKDGFYGFSPGKWICGLQVLDYRTRTPAGFWQSFKRNLPLIFHVFGVLAIWLTL